VISTIDPLLETGTPTLHTRTWSNHTNQRQKKNNSARVLNTANVLYFIPDNGNAGFIQ